MLSAEVGQIMGASGVGTWNAMGGGTIFCNHMPAEPLPANPDQDLYAIYDTGGAQSPLQAAMDIGNIQVLVRNAAMNAAAVKALDVYNFLHGLRDITSPGGLRIVGVVALAPPAYLGPDAQGRHLYSMNFRVFSHNTNRRA